MEHLKATTVFFDVQDMDRAIEFYTKTLGLPIKTRHGDQWAEVDAGTVSIGLHATENGEPVAGPGGGTISFAVSDLEAVLKNLRSKGAAVGEVKNPPRGKFVMVKDSEGNHIHFIEFAKKWKEETGYTAGV